MTSFPVVTRFSTPSYTVQAGDPDPLVNTVTLTCSPEGFPNVLTASDGHETNLFQPSFSVTKTGDELSKVTDSVNYTITLSNTSSTDTPAMTCSANDSLLGNVYNAVLPLGDTVIPTSRTVQAGDPDPLVNTVTVSCSLEGFPNVLGGTASHTTNLFQPAVEVIKTGPVSAPYGSVVTYNFTINNLSSVGRPEPYPGQRHGHGDWQSNSQRSCQRLLLTGFRRDLQLQRQLHHSAD